MVRRMRGLKWVEVGKGSEEPNQATCRVGTPASSTYPIVSNSYHLNILPNPSQSDCQSCIYGQICIMRARKLGLARVYPIVLDHG